MVKPANSIQEYFEYNNRDARVKWELILWAHKKFVELDRFDVATDYFNLIAAKMSEHGLIPEKDKR